MKNIQANALLNLSYAYDPVGNVSRITDTTNSSQVISFGYDFLDRLTTASTSAVGNGQYNENYDYNQIGNLINKAGVTQWYSDTQHDHAITHLSGSQKFWYDANGNMITRTEGSTVFVQQWNVENKLTTVISNGVQTTQFVYDGDGNRVKKIDPNGQPTIYIGALYEKNLSTTITTTYYFAGSTRIAQRQGGVLYYLVGDHLGSTSLTLGQNGAWIGEIKYRPYGETRYISGSIPTDRRFTGQRSEENNLGSLYDYGARFYSPYLNRWLSPDTIVPDPKNPQSLNRYSYVNNNPVKYTDPTGHDPWYCETAQCERQTLFRQPEKYVPAGLEDVYQGDKYDVAETWALLGMAKSIGPQTRQIIESREDPRMHVRVVRDDQSVVVGSFDLQAIDIGDIEKSPNTFSNPAPPTNLVLHEFVEQFERQINGFSDYGIAHSTAINAENTANSERYGSQVAPVRWGDIAGPTNDSVTVLFGTPYRESIGSTVTAVTLSYATDFLMNIATGQWR